MDILYTANKKYIDVMLASIYSIYLNGGLDHITLHIIYSDFSIDSILYIENFLKPLPNVDFNFYYLDEKDIEKYNIPKWKESHIANARLFFQSILKDKVPKKILYIDADTICVGDLKGIVEYDFSPVYAVKDSLHRVYTQRFGHLEHYYNSGVLYIDTEKWDHIDAEGRIVEFAINSPWELVYPDQDIFNCALNTDIGNLSAEYNYPPQVYLFNEEELKRYQAFREIDAIELLEVKDKVKICHSYGVSGIKPWSNNTINPYNDLFMQYIMQVNPDFQKEDLPFKEMMMTRNKKIYKELLLLKTRISSMMVVDGDIRHKSLSKKNVPLDIKK
ncbi:MAG: hypothetical protein OSJ70_00560 [Bacilli bacterium]|nr:hypothetical protein [Bacilli bacterium]